MWGRCRSLWIVVGHYGSLWIVVGSLWIVPGFSNCSRTALKSKQRDLKKKGKGDKPNASVPLTEDDIRLLYDKGLLGKSTPEALMNTIWFNNTVYFGLRGCKEHRDMCCGDVQLHQTTNGEEFLEYTERQTKTRTGENPRDIRQIKPKMFSVQGSERDPVSVYSFYAEKRPSEMNDSNAPFYLAVNSCKSKILLSHGSKSQPLGSTS